ncbi:MAG TPA: FAD synthetase family protein [Chloroflexota bacterium]
MKPAIVTIGNFDGVHLGHLKLLQQVVDRARALGLCSFAVTFEPHPERVLFPERKLTYLSTSDERRDILEACGIDTVWICPFTTELARLEPEEFMRLVTERQPIAELWVGADFALGRGRRGTIAVLADIGAASGWALHMVPPQMLEGQVVSSTAIRTLLAAGAVRGAADLLGRSYSVGGNLEGDALIVDPQRALPKPGVTYDGQLSQAGAVHDVPVTVQPSPGRISLDKPVPHHDGPARLDFLRRAD